MAESLASRLHEYWTLAPAGAGVTMRQMMQALGEGEAQAIRSALTALRMGRVRDPAEPSSRLPKLAVRFNPGDRRYYDFAKLNPATIEERVPGTALSKAFQDLFTRVATLNSAMGEDGFLKASELLDLKNPEIRELIRQVPFTDISRVEDTVREIGRARYLLEIEERTRLESPSHQPEDDSEEGG